MNHILKSILAVLLLIPAANAQKIQIKEAQKELKAGNYEQALSILSPVEYLIRNAAPEDRVNFYHVQGTALVKHSNNHAGAFKNISKAILAFNDLILVESESKNDKFSAEAYKALYHIKEGLILSANDDLVKSDFVASSSKFYQAYLIDTKDTLQLYNAAMSYSNTDDIDTALMCFDQLKTIKYSGNVPVFIAYSKNLLTDELFSTLEERDAKIKCGTHIRPSNKVQSKKGDVFKNIALLNMKKGFKEKALKAIEEAKIYNHLDQSLAIVEANLYLETKDYETFDRLVASILELDSKNAQLASDFGLKCKKEFYFEGAEYYFNEAITMNPLFADSYINLSELLIEKSNTIDSKINSLSILETNKKAINELKSQKEQVLKSAQFNLQKAVDLDPFNNNAKQLMVSVNLGSKAKSKAFVSEE